MKNPRAIAARILMQVMVHGRSLSTALDAATLDARHRALVQELCYGVLRHYPLLQGIARALLKKPFKQKDADVQALVLLGLYQLTRMRVPEHAAVSETVAATAELKKPWARGLVNGVLRNFQRQRAPLLQEAETAEEGHWLHPQWLIDTLREAWPEDWEAILTANNQRPPMTLRVNQRQIPLADYQARLAEAGIAAEASTSVTGAIVLPSPVDVATLPGFFEGLASVQDEAAQLAAGLLRLDDGQRVLDVCAAPGGKTGHILETAKVDLVALDVDELRLQRVADNLDRLAQSAEIVAGDAANPAAWWDGQLFDRILLDAPCSASGVIRRHPDIKLLRRATDIPALVETQARILEAIWPLLKPGGILLYATCSVLPDENVQQMLAFTGRHPEARVIDPNISSGKAQAIGRQIFPGEGVPMGVAGGMDGFYYACFEKQA